MADVEEKVEEAPTVEDPLKPEFPPGLFVEENGEVIPLPSPQEASVPVTPPAPPTRQKPPPPAHQMKHTRRNLIVAAVIVVVVAVTVTLLLVFQPWKSQNDVEQAFTAAVDQYQQAQDDLAQKITAAQATLDIQADVTDSTLLDRLSSALDDARTKVGSAPQMAGSRSEIESQTSGLVSQAQASDDAAAALDQATQAVVESRIQYATDQLNQAVASAQTVLDQSAGTADESLRSALAVAIQRTKTIIAGLATADPATFAATISEQQASLQKASQAVSGAGTTQTTTCDGVEIPSGIDPMVCQSMPSSARKTTTTGGTVTYSEFSMPSGNIGCTVDPNTSAVICEIINKGWTLPAELVAQCPSNGGSCANMEAGIKNGTVTTIGHADPGLWVNNIHDSSMTVPVLAYGQIANFSPVACLSNEHGVVCWDTTTHHGFRMNADEFLYW